MASYLDENGLSHLWSKIKLLVQTTHAPSDAAPLMDGTASAGTSSLFSRGDHVHPSDTTKADKSSTVTNVTFDTTNGFRKTINGSTTTIVTVANLKSALGVVDTDFTGATASAAGTHGLVPAPASGQQGLYLRGDGSWAAPTNTNTTYTLSGALSSHKFTSTLTPSSGTATTSELTLAAGTRITLTDDTANNKITIATTAEINQNAFSNVAVAGQTTVAADSKTDTLNLAEGSNIQITTNASTDTVTIGVTGIENGAEVNQNAFSNVKVGSTTIAADSKTDTLELVAGANVTLTPDATNDKVTIAATDTTYSDVVAGGASGLMTGADKTKLNGIEAGAEVNRTYTAADGGPRTDAQFTLGSSYGTNSLNLVRVQQDATGQVTVSDYIAQLRVATASASVDGLMTSSDYSKLAAFGDASTYALKTDISGIYKYKGSVATAAGLPANPSDGDVYNIEAESTYGPAGTNVAWDGTAWDSLGGLFSITSITNAEIDAICV